MEQKQRIQEKKALTILLNPLHHSPLIFILTSKNIPFFTLQNPKIGAHGMALMKEHLFQRLHAVIWWFHSYLLRLKSSLVFCLAIAFSGIQTSLENIEDLVKLDFHTHT